jgi:hypothetical protein
MLLKGEIVCPRQMNLLERQGTLSLVRDQKTQPLLQAQRPTSKDAEIQTQRKRSKFHSILFSSFFASHLRASEQLHPGGSYPPNTHLA